MDWECKSLKWTDHDFRKFRYRLGESTIVTKFPPNKKITLETHTTSSDWDIWFKKASFLRESEIKPGLCVILCSRDKPVFKGVPARISSLPFERHTFNTIIESLHIHPTITRTIGREVAYFSTQQHGNYGAQNSKLTCTARTSSLLHDDLGLSSTFLTEPGLNLAILYGCNEEQKEQIIHRLETLDLAYNHPMLLPGLLAQLERIRLVGMVDNLLDKFVLRGRTKLSSFLKLCFESRDLMNQIQAVKKQLAKMATETIKFGELISNKCVEDILSPDEEKRLKSAGEQIVSQLSEISDEFDEKVNDCKMVVDNMSLTMQTVWNNFAREDNKTNLKLSRVNTDLARANTALSEDMKRDSSQMRSIALLTMVFLPLSTVASIFSTTLFSWDAMEGKTVVSGYLWVFVVIAIGLTSLTVGAWYLATYRTRRQEASRRGTKTLGLSLNDLP
ncbi:hypothetical protein N431DRAFT_550606 [Stipitochalara longipes BDJ]|nr:hypothetical protein N431DRAFT_550606 [Stipitochalara longipes BDJ]